MTDQPPARHHMSALREFLRGESLGGLVLMGAAALGLLAANSPVAGLYTSALHAHLGPLETLHWINDALMAGFFLLVGLEIKRELLDGQLSTWRSRTLPALAAAGGMLAPALIYVAINIGSPETLRGWATPAATDIAFTLGVLAILGRRAPLSLKIFVTSLAIVDDLGAVVIIAAFYTAQLAWPWLIAASVLLAVLIGFNRFGVKRLWPYLLVGLVLWVCVHESGVHATVAGVLLALTIPLVKSPGRPDDLNSPLHRLEHALGPWVAFAIVPLFGFANAGVSLAGVSPVALAAPVPLGVALGLLLGKPLGIFLTAWLAIRLRWSEPPDDASLAQLFAVSVLCGIGFTMSLFIGVLAFPDNAMLQDEVKLGVLAGSVSSALIGALLLRLASRVKPTAS